MAHLYSTATDSTLSTNGTRSLHIQAQRHPSQLEGNRGCGLEYLDNPHGPPDGTECAGHWDRYQTERDWYIKDAGADPPEPGSEVRNWGEKAFKCPLLLCENLILPTALDFFRHRLSERHGYISCRVGGLQLEKDGEVVDQIIDEHGACPETFKSAVEFEDHVMKAHWPVDFNEDDDEDMPWREFPCCSCEAHFEYLNRPHAKAHDNLGDPAGTCRWCGSKLIALEHYDHLPPDEGYRFCPKMYSREKGRRWFMKNLH